MRLVVNGEQLELREGATPADVLTALGVESRRGVAIAVGADVVPRGEWETRELSEGVRVEVLTAVQGG